MNEHPIQSHDGREGWGWARVLCDKVGHPWKAKGYVLEPSSQKKDYPGLECSGLGASSGQTGAQSLPQPCMRHTRQHSLHWVGWVNWLVLARTT